MSDGQQRTGISPAVSRGLIEASLECPIEPLAFRIPRLMSRGLIEARRTAAPISFSPFPRLISRGLIEAPSGTGVRGRSAYAPADQPGPH